MHLRRPTAVPLPPVKRYWDRTAVDIGDQEALGQVIAFVALLLSVLWYSYHRIVGEKHLLSQLATEYTGRD